jgi:hypothetical protein
MMIIVRADDGSHFEMEEIGEGRIRIRFQDGLTRKVAETTADVRAFPNVCSTIMRNRHMMEDLRRGSGTDADSVKRT